MRATLQRFLQSPHAAELKTNTTITSLDLGDSNLNTESVSALLTSLDLSWNTLSDESASALEKALRINKTLVSLNLTYTTIDEEKKILIENHIQNNNDAVKVLKESFQDYTKDYDVAALTPENIEENLQLPGNPFLKLIIHLNKTFTQSALNSYLGDVNFLNKAHFDKIKALQHGSLQGSDAKDSIWFHTQGICKNAFSLDESFKKILFLLMPFVKDIKVATQNSSSSILPTKEAVVKSAEQCFHAGTKLFPSDGTEILKEAVNNGSCGTNPYPSVEESGSQNDEFNGVY